MHNLMHKVATICPHAVHDNLRPPIKAMVEPSEVQEHELRDAARSEVACCGRRL